MCFAALPAHAKSDVYVGLNVHKTTVKRWTKVVNLSTFKSDTWIWNLPGKDQYHKNGRRDTILTVPDTAYPEDITLVVWFHGLGGFSEKGFIKRILPQVETLVAGGHSFAIAIPEMPWSTNTSTPRGRQGRVWKNAGELERYIADLREHLETWALIKHGKPLGELRLVFVGHSAGGSAIMSAAREGGLCRVKPEAVIWSDASYGYWLDRTMSSCVKSLDTQLHILVRKWDKPHKSAERVMKSLKRSSTPIVPDIRYQVLDRKQWTHSKIGNNVFTLTDVFPPGC